MNRKSGILIGVALFLAFAALLTFQMLSGRQHRYEVCVTFNGSRNCAVASGANQAEAVRTGTSTACAVLAGGVTEVMACERTEPVSVRQLD